MHKVFKISLEQHTLVQYHYFQEDASGTTKEFETPITQRTWCNLFFFNFDHNIFLQKELEPEELAPPSI